MTAADYAQSGLQCMARRRCRVRMCQGRKSGILRPVPGQEYVPSAFATDLLRRMMKQRGSGPMLKDWRDGLHPAFSSCVDPVLHSDRVRLHDHAAALNSSMVFGLNLFLGFRLGNVAPLSALLEPYVGEPIQIEEVKFEFGGPGRILGELRRETPEPNEAFTASDVAVFVATKSQRGVVLLEVKLSEQSFTHCGGATSPANRRLDVCDSATLFFERPQDCYLRRPRRADRDRRYWEIFEKESGTLRAAFPAVDLDGQCPFRGNAQQIMRNHALALGLVQEGVVDFWRFGLVHHDRNPDVSAHWGAYVGLAANADYLFTVPASHVASAADQALRADPPLGHWLQERYLLAANT